ATGFGENLVQLALAVVQHREVTGDRGLVTASGGTRQRLGRAQSGDVLDSGAHEVEVRVERHVRGGGDSFDLREQRDEMVRSDDRGRVVGGAMAVRHLERAPLERLDDGLDEWVAGDREPRAAQSLGTDL